MATPTEWIWAVREGKVVELRLPHGAVVKIDPTPLATILGAHPTALPAPLAPHPSAPMPTAPEPPLPPASPAPAILAQPVAPEPPATAFGLDAPSAPPKPPTPPTKSRPGPLPLTKLDPDQEKYASPPLPRTVEGKAETTRRFISRKSVERMFALATKYRPLTVPTIKEHVKNDPMQQDHIYITLEVWQLLGMARKDGRGSYLFHMPSDEEVLAVIKSLEQKPDIGVNAWRLANEFWVPKAGAQKWLERFAREGKLREALNGEFFTLDPNDTPSLLDVVQQSNGSGGQKVPTVSRDPLKAAREPPGAQAQLVSYKLPVREKWRQFTGEYYKCLFGHGGTKVGWGHGVLKMCDECYKNRAMW